MRPKLNYANVVATLALFVALGGSAYAAKKLTGKDIAKGAIAAKHVDKNAIKSKHIKDDKLKGKDIKEESLDGSKLNITHPDPGGPIAYARLKPDGTLEDSMGIQQSQVSHTADSGTYCFDVDGAEHAQATGIVAGDGLDDIEDVTVKDKATYAAFAVDIDFDVCGNAGNEFAVGIETASEGAEDAYFYVAFWG